MALRGAAVLLAAAVLASCAGGGAAGPGAAPVGAHAIRQADHRAPENRGGRFPEIDDDAERARYTDANTHAARAKNAADSGNMDQARAEFRVASDQLADLADRYRSSNWRIVYRRLAAEYAMRANAFDLAAQQAERIRQDPGAREPSKAFAARLAAGAWHQHALAESKAGRIEPLRLLTAAQRKGEKPRPRPPGDVWRRFVESADQYGASWRADADPQAAEHAATLAYLAAQVHFAHDNLEEARRRLDGVIQQFPASEHAADAIALYLQTWAVLGDQEGYRAAAQRVSGAVDQQLAAAQKQAGTSPEAKERAERLQKLKASLTQEERAQGFSTAMSLLQAGRPAEAAAAFEQHAADNPQSDDAANALYNAGVAWDQAKQPAKAAAAREKLLASYPESRVAGSATLALASSRSKANRHEEAAELYARYLERFPEGENRCLALLNVGVENDQAGRAGEAARRYLTFAETERCVKEDPDNSAILLYRAAQFFQKAKRPAEQRRALERLAALQGVKQAAARSYVEDAKAQLARSK
jgi:TolA-binding protein